MEFDTQKMKAQYSENNFRVEKAKKVSYKRVFKPHPSQTSLTQSLFPSKKNSLRDMSYKNSHNTSQMCQTLTNGFGVQWQRPESKRASRKQSSRPQTSKGTRMITRERFTQEPWKIYGTSKSMYQQINQTPVSENMNESQIHIILNQREKGEKIHKEKSVYGEKFKTELPDDFLCLFAD